MVIEDMKLYGLAFVCPYQDRFEKCPMLEVEHLTLSEKYLRIMNLSLNEKQRLIESHSNFSKNRV